MERNIIWVFIILFHGYLNAIQARDAHNSSGDYSLNMTSITCNIEYLSSIEVQIDIYNTE